MTGIDMFHIGLLVHDLDQAIDRFGEVLGLTFKPPTTVHLDLAGEGPDFELRATYSTEGPPYFELIESRGTGIFSPELAEGPHHIGIYVPDIEASLALCQEPINAQVDEQIRRSGRTTTWYSTPASLHGLRVEFVDAKRRPTIEAWLTGAVAELGQT